MKKTIFAAALATTTAFAAPAFAQSNVSINLQGSVPLSCTVVANPSIVNPELLDLNNTATDQQLGSLTYQCNNAGGFTRNIKSANGGTLNRDGGAAGENNIPYQARSGGGSGLSTALATLSTSGIDTALAGSTSFVTGQTGSVFVKVGAPSGPLFAGNYKDTITVTVTPN
jgi:spore coat protein U-like protein